ncbi:DnaJ family domain-containing protein [Microbacterium sp. MAHUQ-60]|uniref:DnaJ family domain-containing protein n=1 Tax=unclassified Microbacterium TaxID=2609290 RepID=UPI00360E188E
MTEPTQDPNDVEQDKPPMALNAQNKAEFVETAIQLAIRRGDFDDLPGAGKPIEGLGTHHDPDWWIRRKIETENLSGLGPPALLLRNEDRGLDDELDLLAGEDDVREVVEDFNRRVIAARRQLLGGPPVVTRTRDVEVEISAWRARRAAAAANPQPDDTVAETTDAVARRGLWRWLRR